MICRPLTTMITKLSVVFATLIGLNVTAAYAQQPAWEKEPTTFRGITIGGPLPSTIPECPLNSLPRSQFKSYVSNPTGVCFKELTGGARFNSTLQGMLYVVELINMPDIGIRDRMYVSALDDKIERISLGFRPEAISSFKSVLIERYGPPTTTEKIRLQNRLGAEFIGEESVWRGRNFAMTLSQYDTSVSNPLDSASLEITTNIWNNRIGKGTDSNKQKARDNL